MIKIIENLVDDDFIIALYYPKVKIYLSNFNTFNQFVTTAQALTEQTFTEQAFAAKNKNPPPKPISSDGGLFNSINIAIQTNKKTSSARW